MLKEGNLVKIKQLNIHDSYPSGICSDMLKFSGMFTIITRHVGRNDFRISIDTAGHSWNKEMFEDYDQPHVICPSDLPIELYSNIFGKVTLKKITNDAEYSFDLKLKDGDIISVTKDFKFFKDSKKNIF